VAQDVGNPTGPIHQYVLVVEKGSLYSHLEGPASDSASLHYLFRETDIYSERKRISLLCST
jgi:hypothetical protein